jgi:hypothetical protein
VAGGAVTGAGAAGECELRVSASCGGGPGWRPEESWEEGRQGPIAEASHRVRSWSGLGRAAGGAARGSGGAWRGGAGHAGGGARRGRGRRDAARRGPPRGCRSQLAALPAFALCSLCKAFGPQRIFISFLHHVADPGTVSDWLNQGHRESDSFREGLGCRPRGSSHRFAGVQLGQNSIYIGTVIKSRTRREWKRLFLGPQFSHLEHSNWPSFLLM